MKITQVVVGIHEKRNHPYKYGHYDASVTFTADIALNDDPDGAVDLLRARARRHVLSECDAWEKTIHEEHRLAKLISDFDYQISNNLHWDTVSTVEKCNKIIEQLPEEMRAEHRKRLIEAVDQLPPKEQARGDDYPNVSCQDGEEEIEF